MLPVSRHIVAMTASASAWRLPSPLARAGIRSAAVQCERPREFHHGLPNGHGTLRLGNGEVFTGQWHDGCLTGGKQVAAVGVAKEKCGIR